MNKEIGSATADPILIALEKLNIYANKAPSDEGAV